MPKVNFILPNDDIVEVESAAGASVMEIGKQAGIEEMIGECGGGLNCATCHVHVRDDWWDRIPPATEDELDLLEASHEPGPTSRLSCQIIMTDQLDGLAVRMPASQT